MFLFSFNLFLSYFLLLAFISRCIHCVTYDEEEISFTSVSVTCTRCDLRLTNDRRLYIYIFIIFLLYIYIFLFFFNLFLSYFPLLAFISRCIHCVTKKKPLFARFVFTYSVSVQCIYSWRSTFNQRSERFPRLCSIEDREKFRISKLKNC